MKNTKTITFNHQTITLLAICIAVLAIVGCETMIPDADSQTPEIRLAISGPGIGRREMTNPPRDRWTGPGGGQLFDLMANREYQFLLTVTDQGGVARANLLIPELLGNL